MWGRIRQRDFGVKDHPACPKCGKAMVLVRRTPHPEYGSAFERQTFTCFACDREIERSADAYGNPRGVSDAARGEAQPDLPLQRNVILGLLLALTAVAWAVLVWEHHSAAMDMGNGVISDIGLHAPLVLAIWVVVMMVAMMLPTATPMILTLHRVQAGKHRLAAAFVSTWLFVAAYLLVWISVGFAAYAAVLAAEAKAPSSCAASPSTAHVGGVILMAGGSLPAHPLKGGMPRTVSCAHALHRDLPWREGAAGAFQMGWLHGALLSWAAVGCSSSFSFRSG